MNYISVQSSRDVIEHFGIKGMRWGIRSRHAGLKQLHNILADIQTAIDIDSIETVIIINPICMLSC